MGDSETGIHFGAYRLLSRLGVGGMGETWRAVRHDAQGVSKDVVIKRILRTYSEDAAFREAFISEARLSARLSHGNVAQVFEFGEVEGEYFMALEYVAGKSLQGALDRLVKRGLVGAPPAFAVYVAMEMLKGLHHAHQRTGPDGKPLHIVHRDVSPDNVLLSYEGEVKVVDFGIAKAQVAGRRETEPGVVKGKYLYFAPEQARGEAVDARTDVFAAGVVLYAMLAGRLPVEGQAHVVMRKVALGEVPILVERAPWVPSALSSVVARAMAPQKEQRFPSALAFQQALAPLLHELAPDASQLLVSGMMAWLFGQELSALGRTVVVPGPVQRMVEEHRQRAVPIEAVPTRDHPALAKATDPAAMVTGQSRDDGGGLPRWVVPAVVAGGLLLTGLAVWAMHDAENGPQAPQPLSRPAPASAGETIQPKPGEDLTPAARDLKLAQARVLINKGDWAGARDLLLQIREHGMSTPQTESLSELLDAELPLKQALERADQLLSEGKLDEAKKLLQSTDGAQLLGEQRARIAARLAAAGEQRIASGAALREAQPGDVVRGLADKGRNFLAAGHSAEAKRVLLECVKVDSKAYECMKLLGSTFARLGDAESSVKYYRKFLETAPFDHPDRVKVQQMLDSAGR